MGAVFIAVLLASLAWAGLVLRGGVRWRSSLGLYAARLEQIRDPKRFRRVAASLVLGPGVVCGVGGVVMLVRPDGSWLLVWATPFAALHVMLLMGIRLDRLAR